MGEKTGKRQIISTYYMQFVIALWFGSEVLINSNMEKIYIIEMTTINDIMSYAVLVLLGIQIFILQDYQVRELLGLFLISLPVVIGTINSGHNILMSTWLFVLATKYVDLDKVVEIHYYVLVIMLVILFTLFGMGFIKDVVLYRGSIVRHSFGFSHPNFLGMRVFQLALARAYIRRKNISAIDYLFVIAAIWFVYKYPNCKTAYYALTVFLIFMIIYKAIGVIENGREVLLIAMGIMAGLVNISCIVLSIINVKSHSILSKIDKVMSYRFSLCHDVYRKYGLSLLGQNIDMVGYIRGVIGRKYYMDIAYTTLLERYGIIVYIIFSVVYMMSIYWAYKYSKDMLMIVLCMYSIYGIMEPNYFSLSYNIFLIALSYPLYSKQYSVESFARVKPKYRIVLN